MHTDVHGTRSRYYRVAAAPALGGGGSGTAMYAFAYPGTCPMGAYPMGWATRNFKRSLDDLHRTCDATA